MYVSGRTGAPSRAALLAPVGSRSARVTQVVRMRVVRRPLTVCAGTAPDSCVGHTPVVQPQSRPTTGGLCSEGTVTTLIGTMAHKDPRRSYAAPGTRARARLARRSAIVHGVRTRISSRCRRLQGHGNVMKCASGSTGRVGVGGERCCVSSARVPQSGG